MLFDIDGTLVRRAGPQHLACLVESVRGVLGIETRADGIPVQGMLDGEILRLMMKNCGVADLAIRQSMPALIRRAQWLYSRRCPADLTEKVCPGVRSFLADLHRRGMVKGLVTGNLSRIAWKKMERAGLKSFFRFGAFAESANTRAGLVKLALSTARQRGWLKRSTPTFHIGDHPNDVIAAKSNGIRSIAVGTGVVSMDELATYQPDYLVPDLSAIDPTIFR